MFDIMNQLKSQNMQTKMASSIVPGWNFGGNFSDDLIAQGAPGGSVVYFEGDSTIASMDFSVLLDLRMFPEGVLYRGKIEREYFYGTGGSGWNSGGGVLYDTMTIMFLPKQAGAVSSNEGYYYTAATWAHHSISFKWTRALDFANSGSAVVKQWTYWEPVINPQRFMTVRMFANQGLYLDMRLASNWYIDNYNPANWIFLLMNGLQGFAPAVLTIRNPVLSGTPTMAADGTGKSFAWTKPFSVVAGKTAKILVDGSSSPGVILFTGVNAP